MPLANLKRLLENPGTGVVDPQGPGAVIGLIADGELREVAARGVANLEHGIPISRKSVFNVASVSKQFTAYAAAVLHQEQRLRLAEPAARYLEWFPFQNINLRHLIHHVSGVRDQEILLLFGGRRMEDSVTTRDLISIISRQQDLNFPPGTQYCYSNTGYTLLTMIIEAVTGRPLNEFCAERIFDPLGMRSSAFVSDHHDVIPELADSYYRRPDGRYGRVARSHSYAGGTSLYTTIDDLARWAQHTMTQDCRDLLEQQITLPEGDLLEYAMGVKVSDFRGIRALTHSGSDAGYRSHLLVLPSERAAVIVLSNFAEQSAQALAHEAADLLLRPTSNSRAANTEPSVTTASGHLAGRYLDDADVLYEIRLEEGRVFLRFGFSELMLRPHAPGRFIDEQLDTEVESAPDGIVLHPRVGASRFCRRLDELCPNTADKTPCAGVFYSPELEVMIRIDVPEGGRPTLRGRGWGTVDLHPLGPNLFYASMSFLVGINDIIVTVRMSPDGNELLLSTSRAGRIRFLRLTD